MNAIAMQRSRLRQRIIDYDGNIVFNDLIDIIEEAKQLGLTEQDIARLVPEIDREINWEHIRHLKKLEAEQRQAEEKAEETRQEEAADATAFLDALVSDTLRQSIVTGEELSAIFARAEASRQNTPQLASAIKRQIDEHKLRPWPKPDLSKHSLKEYLCATDWYDEATFPKPSGGGQITGAQQQPPSKTRSGWAGPVLLLVLLIAAAVAIGFYAVNRQHKLSDSGGNGMQTKDMAMSPAALSAPAPLVPDTPHIATPPQSYQMTPLMELARGPGQSGLSEAEASAVYRAVTGYYQAGNASPKEQSGIEKYFRFPVSWYYGTPAVTEMQIAKNMHFQDSFFVFTQAELLPASSFQTKEGGKYFIQTEEVFRYRTQRDRDSLITKSVKEHIVLNGNYTIDSVYQTRNKVTGSEYSPLTDD